MSNPGVVVLSSGKVGRSNFCVEDNIGESLHIHMDDIRLDFTVEGYRSAVDSICRAIDEIYQFDGFSVRDIDPVFLSSIIGRLPDLIDIKIDKIRLEELRVAKKSRFGSIRLYPLSQSKVFKSLNGDKKENKELNLHHHIGQTSDERLGNICDSIKSNGYPKDGRYIILFNDSPVIHDGQHRASCLLYLSGDIETPVMRMYFKNKKYDFHRLSLPAAILKSIKKSSGASIRRWMVRMYKGAARIRHKMKRRLWMWQNADHIKRFMSMYK